MEIVNHENSEENISATGTLTHSMDQIVELGNLDKSTS